MLWTDFTKLVGAILLVVGAILPIVNPPGAAPLFLRLTAGCDAHTHRVLAARIALNSFALLVGSMFLGTFVLRLFELSVSVVQVAGGAVVCALGWNLLNEEQKAPDPHFDRHRASDAAMQRSFYPLTMPLTVDPGALAVGVAIGANHAHVLDQLLIQITAAVVGSTIIALTILLTYSYARRIEAHIGPNAMSVVVRLSAFIVLSIGVHIAWNGIKGLLWEVGIHA
jgi:multiple antibiotic resistance protein